MIGASGDVALAPLPTNLQTGEAAKDEVKGQTEVVKMLLNAGADKDKPVKDDATALYVASYGGHTDVVKLLLAACCLLALQCRWRQLAPRLPPYEAV